ncbi:MAG: phage holin family protein [Peptoniphilaceae bacterium]|nr:phage holin family protein [Peptoniphilaceae bacterium]MDY3075399.1 phage holin family protein [Peptoniphilaceae bacterium]
MGLLITWVANGISLWILDALFSIIQFQDNKTLIITALMLTLVNAIVKPILKILTLPLTILTLGLFSFVVNAIVLSFAFFLGGAEPISLGWAIIAGIVLGFINRAVLALLGKNS